MRERTILVRLNNVKRNPNDLNALLFFQYHLNVVTVIINLTVITSLLWLYNFTTIKAYITNGHTFISENIYEIYILQSLIFCTLG